MAWIFHNAEQWRWQSNRILTWRCYCEINSVCFITWHIVLQKILPPGYSHLLCRHELLEMSGDVENFRACLKLQLTTKEEVQKWLEDFQKTSALTWRKSRTYPDSGRYNKYRVGITCYVCDRALKATWYQIESVYFLKMFLFLLSYNAIP